MVCRYPLSVCFLVLVFSFCALSTVGAALDEGLTIRPQTILLNESAGKFARAEMSVTNQLNHSVDVRIKEITGDITKAIPSVDKARVTVYPGQTASLGFNGYVLKGTASGDYGGELVLVAGDEEYRVSVRLVIGGFEDTPTTLSIRPLREEIRPGETLEVVSEIRSSLKEKQLIYVLRLLDPASGEEIVSGSENITLDGSARVTIQLKIPEDVGCTECILDGVLYSPMSSGNLTSSKASVRIKSPDIFSYIRMPQLTAAQIQLILLGVSVLVVLSLLVVYHMREKAKRRRYLESIDVKALPKKGPNSGFIGRVAETEALAYIKLDQLQIHALIAGATGCGKTVVAQVLAEEALLHGRSVLVFDPTAQWTGFLRKNKDKGMFRLYRYFHMKEKDAKAFDGNVYVIKDVGGELDVQKYMNPGEISVFCLNKLDPSMIDVFVENTIKAVFDAGLEESSELKVLFVYDEVHRLLPKFGGSGRGLLQINRAVREFRKWGVGLVLISQVLSDFVGEIKANIGTEIQMRTRYEDDLKRVKMKYGADTFKSVVKASVGTGMLQNAQYNNGRPYFVTFRPLLHNTWKLDRRELDLYAEFNVKFNTLMDKIETLKKADVDIFDIELELNLAQENLRKGSFTVVELYLASLQTRVDQYLEKLRSNKITEKEKAIRSEWELKKDDELEAYDAELKALIEEQKESLGGLEKELVETESKEKAKIGGEEEKLLKEEMEVRKELELLEHKLESRSRVLDILKRFQERIEILNEAVIEKEEEKLEAGEGELELTKEREEQRLTDEKKVLIDRERKTMAEIAAEKKHLEKEAQRLRDRLEEIKHDKEMIVEKDKMISDAEDELRDELKDKLRIQFEGEPRVDDTSLGVRVEETEKAKPGIALERVEERPREGVFSGEWGREERTELKMERDKLRTQLKEMKEKWRILLEKEQEVYEKEIELNKKIREQELLMEEERTRMQAAGEEWEKVSFEDMDEEWDKMNQLRENRDGLKQELDVIRDGLKKQRELRSKGEEKIRRKEEELKGLEDEEGVID